MDEKVHRHAWLVGRRDWRTCATQCHLYGLINTSPVYANNQTGSANYQMSSGGDAATLERLAKALELDPRVV